jgi:parallel beta-helix repeat protein
MRLPCTSGGGGVNMTGGTFTMNGGTVRDNTAATGGGVYPGGGVFTMNGGTISGNTATGATPVQGGGGVFVGGGNFTMSGGAVSGNTAASNGGGVYVVGNGTFTMEGNAAVSRNIASLGGGVYVPYGTFNMKGGSVGGNEAAQGGGVVVAYADYSSYGYFHMADGVIYGTNHTVDSEKNKATATTNGYAALALINTSLDKAQRGTFDAGGNFENAVDLLSAGAGTNATITVVNGGLP